MPRSHAMRQLVTNYALFYRLLHLATSDLELFAVPLRVVVDEVYHGGHRSEDLLGCVRTALRRACDKHVATGVIEPLTDADDEAIATFAVTALTMNANLETALYGSMFTDQRAYEIAETYREARHMQSNAAQAPSGGSLVTVLDHYLTFYLLSRAYEATRDELALPVIVATQIASAFPALDDTQLGGMIVGAIVHACLPLQRQKRLSPLLIEDIPAIHTFATYLITHYFPVQAGKRKRLLPATADLARQLADLYRRGEATAIARRMSQES